PLGLPLRRAALRWNAHADAAASQSTTKPTTIVSAIRHQLLGPLSRTSPWTSYRDRIQSPLSEPDFGDLRALQMKAQREPVTVDNEHPLGALALLRDADLVAAFLSGREGAVEEGHGPIEVTMHVEGSERCPPDALPDAGLSPPFQPSPDRCRRTILARQVLPAAASNEHVRDTLEEAQVVRPWQ